MRFTSEPFSVKHPDGMTVRGVAYLPVDAPQPVPAVIASHGFNDVCANLRNRGEAYAAAGIACFTYDFRGGSVRTTSDGILSEMMTLDTELADLKLMVSWVRALPDVLPDQVYLHGESQGGMVSVLAAQDDPGAYPGLLLWYPALVIPEDSARRVAQHVDQVFGIRLNPEFDLQAMKVDPWEKMPLYPGRVLLLQGSADPVVPPLYTEKAEKLYPHARRIVYEGAGHGFKAEQLADALRSCTEFILKG